MRAARVQLQLLNMRETNIEPEFVADLAKEAFMQSESGADAFVVRCPKCNSENVRVIEEARRARIAWVT
jgi:Zn finger protein HypA/HybF involved in hydrogenase expression